MNPKIRWTKKQKEMAIKADMRFSTQDKINHLQFLPDSAEHIAESMERLGLLRQRRPRLLKRRQAKAASKGEDINKAQVRYFDQDWLRKAQIVKEKGVRDEVVAIPSDEMQ